MWYHVVREFFGNEKVFLPKIPQLNSFCRCEEGNIPRICVSNSLFNCLRAITGLDRGLYPNILKKNFAENPCVYATEEVPLLPPNCLDFRQNEERWFIKRTKFMYLARIDIEQLLVKKIIVPTQEKKIVWPEKIYTVNTVKENFILSLIKEHKGDDL